VQRPPEPVFTEPPPRAQRRAQVRYDASPRLVMAFPKPAPPARDDLVLDVIEVLLAEGHTGRLTQRLVYRDHLAQSVNVSEGPGQRLDGLVSIQVAPLSGVPLAAVEAAVWEELSALARSPPEPAELSKARTRVAADLERSLDGNAEIASALSRAQALWGDWRLVFTRTAEVESVTGAEVQAVAGRLFAPEHAVIVTLGREGEAR
jgi:predicted Zn-dependent peptidase